jgi:hypothetical protein
MHINRSKILIFISCGAHRQRINRLLNMLLFLRTLTHPRPRIYNITVFLVKFASTLKKIICILNVFLLVEGIVGDQRVSN